jgi:hypothetical protein
MAGRLLPLNWGGRRRKHNRSFAVGAGSRSLLHLLPETRPQTARPKHGVYPCLFGSIPTSASRGGERSFTFADIGDAGRLGDQRPVLRFRIRLRRKSTTPSTLSPDGLRLRLPPGGFDFLPCAIAASTSLGLVRAKRSSASSKPISRRSGEECFAPLAICHAFRRNGYARY